MKRTFSILIFLISGQTAARAENVTLQPVPAPEAAPTLVANEPACEQQAGAGLVRIRIQRMKLEGHEVNVLQECGSTDRSAELAFETKDGWQRYHSGEIAYQAGNMTDAPLNISLLLEAASIVKVRGKAAVLHRIDTAHRNINHDGSVAADLRYSRIDVCAFDNASTAQCGHVEVECPETGCKEPQLIKGALWLHAKGGRKRFPIELPKTAAAKK